HLPAGKVPDTGRLFTNKTLAETYTRLLRTAEGAGGDRVAQIEAARKTWSQGFVAEAIDRFCRTQAVMDTSGEPHYGVLTGDDTARWHAHVEAPLTYDYGRYTACKPGPRAQGPVMLQQLALLKGFDLDGADPVSADFVHLLVECSKLAYADREKFYGDPDFASVPMATLLSDAYNDERRKLVGDKASRELRPGSVEGFGAVVKLRREEGTRRAVGGLGAGEPTVGGSCGRSSCRTSCGRSPGVCRGRRGPPPVCTAGAGSAALAWSRAAGRCCRGGGSASPRRSLPPRGPAKRQAPPHAHHPFQ